MKSSAHALEFFQWIPSQTLPGDRRALVSIREVVAARRGRYSYLEVGSYLGGSIQPHIGDRRCERIVSIDPRPLISPDERNAGGRRYQDNSTQRMLDNLRLVPGADLNKITAFEINSWELSESDVPHPVDFAFIDGEHTHEAALRDYRSLVRFLGSPGVIAFHDSWIVHRAIAEIRKSPAAPRRPAVLLGYPFSSITAIVFDEQATYAASMIEQGWRRHLPIGPLDRMIWRIRTFDFSRPGKKLQRIVRGFSSAAAKR